MTHQCSHERTPASAHASTHASVHESAHKSWLSLCYNPIQRLPLECSRECSRGFPRKCTRSDLVVCHLVCFHLLCSLPSERSSGDAAGEVRGKSGKSSKFPVLRRGSLTPSRRHAKIVPNYLSGQTKNRTHHPIFLLNSEVFPWKRWESLGETLAPEQSLQTCPI